MARPFLLAALLAGGVQFGVPAAHACPPQDLNINNCAPTTESIDPIVCPIISSLSPGIPGVVEITPDGDVYILGEFFWDCPPYDNV